MKKVLLSLIFLSVILPCTGTSAFEVRMRGDRLTLHADHVPLQTLLLGLADLGVKIRIDPEINPEINASFEDRDIRQGLDSILKPFDHALIWKSIEGPEGPIPRLAEIQVFKPGGKALIKALGTKTQFAVARNPEDGSLYIKNEILLGLGQDMTLAEFEAILRPFGGIIVDSYTALGIYKVRFPEGANIPSLAKQIAKHPKVAKAEPNYAYPLPGPDRQTPSNLKDKGLSKNLSNTGVAVPIAVLDTGLGADSGMEPYVLASLDAVNPDEPLSDSLGHGTQMGLIASGVVNPTGVEGDSESYNSIIPIRIFDDNGFTSNFTIMRSIDFSLEHGARVMSLSWGSETRSDLLENALSYARSKGLVVVASAGNEPTGQPVYPAAFSSVIGVGALRPDGKPWEESNYGDFVTMYAPGFASLPVGYKGDPGGYAGTSISAAFTANVISKYLSEHPNATMEEILRALAR